LNHHGRHTKLWNSLQLYSQTFQESFHPQNLLPHRMVSQSACKCGVKIYSQNHHIAIKIKSLSWGLQCPDGSTEATWKLPLNRN